MEEVNKEILETFKKVKVNTPPLDAIKHILIYAKFLKELCTHKTKFKRDKRINIGRNVFAFIGKLIPQIFENCKDSDMFCIASYKKFENAMLNLRGSITVIPLSIFNSLSLGPLQPTGVVI